LGPPVLAACKVGKATVLVTSRASLIFPAVRGSRPERKKIDYNFNAAREKFHYSGDNT
jgi:hypothetical protein